MVHSVQLGISWCTRRAHQNGRQ